MIEFSHNLIKVIQKSIIICQAEKQSLVNVSHLIRAMLETKGCLAGHILSHNNTSEQKLPAENNFNINSVPELSPKVEQLIQKALSIAYEWKHNYVGTEHLLAAIIELPDKKELSQFNLSIEQIKKRVKKTLAGCSQLPNISQSFALDDKYIDAESEPESNDSILSHYTTDLTDPRNFKNINPLIGREKELQRMMQILGRKDKNNPLIIGSAGVGKTALVEGLAQKISQKQAPLSLQNKKILSLDLGSLVAGSIYRGEFENRLKALVKEIEKRSDIIIFIDELHNLVGAGSSQGTMDAANLLKPVLARGQISCIGATTLEEYKKHIEKDAALERRFQPISLNEPNKQQTLLILQGIKENYQKFHQVTITDQAIEAAVELSDKHIHNHLMPDKAIDLLDEAAAKVKYQHQSEDLNHKKLVKLNQALNILLEQKKLAVKKENFNEAIKLKQKQKDLNQKIHNLQTVINQAGNRYLLDSQEIIAVLSQKLNIEPQELTANEYKKLNLIGEQLKKIIFSQNNQIDQIIKTIARAKLGLSDQNGPLAAMLLVGPTGVGKTETIKSLAKLLFDEPACFIQLNLSEFNDKLQISRLIGSPAGYVGYRENNQFTDKVKTNPKCLILLDEIEKAHPEVINLFTQILDQGFITDSVGKNISFRQSIIMFTCNSLHEFYQKEKIGFGPSEETIQINKELKNHLPTELINRLDAVIEFNQLVANDLSQILRDKINSLQLRLNIKNLNLKIDSAAIDSLLPLIMAEKNGARAVKNIIKAQIEHPLMELILKGNKKQFIISNKQNKIIIQ